MIAAVGFHRLNLIRLGRDEHNKRAYHATAISEEQLTQVRKCVLHGLGMFQLTKHL